MLDTLVSEVKELCNQASEVKEIDGKKFSASPYYQICTKDRAETVPFSDLSSIVPIVKNELLEYNLPIYVVVNEYNEVTVITSLDGDRERERPYRVTYDGTPFQFGREYSFEQFVIALRSKFVQNGEIAELLSFLKCVTNSASVSTQDDGISQRVSSVKGTTGYKETAPIRRLAPFRTFNEVEQPTSEFLFRIYDSGELFSLHEADGGAWKKKAKDSIKEYYENAFADEIKDGKIIILS